MSLGVIQTLVFRDIVWKGVVDEAFDFFTFSLLVLIFVLIINLGLDIKEDIPSIPAAFATMALKQVRRLRLSLAGRNSLPVGCPRPLRLLRPLLPLRLLRLLHHPHPADPLDLLARPDPPQRLPH